MQLRRAGAQEHVFRRILHDVDIGWGIRALLGHLVCDFRPFARMDSDLNSGFLLEIGNQHVGGLLMLAPVECRG